MTQYTGYYQSPIGIIEVITDEDYLYEIKFVDKITHSSFYPKILTQTLNQLDEYFNGVRTNFNLEYKLEGTEFQILVWNALSKIPYGHQVSYKEIATSIGRDKASRAVGNANNKNKLSIIIPCHRVVGSNKKLIGYEWGLDRKQWLLEHEKQYRK